MSIQNKQLEAAAKKQTATAGAPSTLTGEGAFFVKTVNGITEGFYVDDEGNQVQITSNGSLAAVPQSTTAKLLQSKAMNGSGSSLDPLTPITIDANGHAVYVNVSNEFLCRNFAGLVSSLTAPAATVTINTYGVMENVITTGSFGDFLYVSKTGSLTNVAPDIGVNGFVSGDFIIKIGKITANVSTPTNKDIILSPCLVGQM